MPPGDTAHRLVGGRYALREPLGQGGMGTVWRAFDELLRRHVAVKQVSLPPAVEGTDPPATRDRVLREAQAAARLSHPSSVTVFDVLEDDGHVHIVMELLDADTLAETVEARGPLDVEEAARIGLDLAGALDAAHRQGVVHRDVKPANVMMLEGGGVKLTDFGIATVHDDPRLTATGQVVGSPSYMAPEQATGAKVGPPADWWGLGATLHYAVEGRPPFERDGPLSTLAAVVNDDAEPAERAGPMAPLLGRLLAKDPALRPSASELRARLRELAWETPAATGGHRPAGTVRDVVPPQQIGPTGSVATAAPGGGPRAAAPGGGPRAAAPVGGPGGRGRGPLVGAVVFVVAALLVAVAAWSASRDPGGSGARGVTRDSGDDTATPESTATTAADPTTADPTTAEGIPDGWVTYTDPRVGYRIAHPPGWQVRPLDGTRTDIRDPDTGSYLRVDWTDRPGPSPEGAWESLSSSFGARHEAYDEIRIEPTTYQGFDAAVWEYAYTSQGARLHAVNLGMVTGTYGFALNFQTAEGRWEASQDDFDAFKASFRPPA